MEKIKIEIIIPEGRTYNQYIEYILSIRPNKKDEENYQELHHIIPKCLKGTNDKDNLVYLYAQEHYYAHKLLALENEHDKNLQFAWWNMCSALKDGRNYPISADDYAEARQRVGEYISKNRTGANNPNYGKHFSEDHKKKLALSHIGLPKSEKTIKLISEHHADVSGANNPRAIAVECIETGQRFSTQTEACKWCGISLETMRRHLIGKSNCGGKNPLTNESVHWKYAE